MRRLMKSVVTMLLVLIGLGASAQYKLNNDLSAMYIDGTSSLHDWTETVEQMSGTLNLTLNGSAIEKITGINASIPVNSIKSGKGGMDDNTYKALKQKSHPNITYKLKSFAVKGDVVYLTGMLTIAGETREVKFQSKYVMVGEQLKFSGKHTFNMTDFKIDPPTAVMGTIKTGDQVTIRFELVFTK